MLSEAGSRIVFDGICLSLQKQEAPLTRRAQRVRRAYLVYFMAFIGRPGLLILNKKVWQ